MNLPDIAAPKSETPDFSDSIKDNQSFEDADLNDDLNNEDEIIANLNQDQVFLKAKKEVFAEAERIAKESGFVPFKESELDYLRREDTKPERKQGLP